MSISVIPPPEFAHVNNPVFVSVSGGTAGNTILMDIYHNGEILYTASAIVPAALPVRINIAEVLQSIVQTPLLWPLPADLFTSIVNWLGEYRLVATELDGTTVISSWTSGTLYAIPGGIDDGLFLELQAAGTDIFQSRLLNPDANRFLTVYAGTADPVLTLPENPSLADPHPSLLFFIARPGDEVHIEVPATGTSYDYKLPYAALYCINPTIAGNRFTVRFNASAFLVTVNFEPPIKSWPARTWFFINHFGVFEPYLTTGRAKTSVTRPDHVASRYIPNLDKFYDIDLGSQPVETISLPSGLTNAAGMLLFRHFALSDCIFLLSAESSLSSYIIKQSDRIITDDLREPSSTDIVLTRSLRDGLAPDYRDPETSAYNLINGLYNLISGPYNLINKSY